MKFEMEHVFITGGSGGIGSVVASKFLKEGAIVTITSETKEDAKTAEFLINFRAGGNGGNLSSVVGDLSDPVELERMFDEAIELNDEVTILINCVGVATPKKFEDITIDEWNKVLNTNLTSYFLGIQKVIGPMKEKRWGKIVNISSIAGKRFSKLCGLHYTVSKHGIIGLTKHLASKLGPFNININCICPGQTYTKMLKPFLTKQLETDICSRIPLGYIAQPEDQANIIMFLCSEEASYLTGTCIDVTGGQS